MEGGITRRTARQDILKAHVERGVGVRGEDGLLLAGNVLGLAVLVARGVRDLGVSRSAVVPVVQDSKSSTHVHVELHAVALVAVDNGRDDDQHVLGDKVADAAARVLVVAVARLDVELERLRADRQQQQQAAEPL